MKLELEQVRISNIGGRTGLPGRVWASVDMFFKDADTRHSHEISTRVLLPFEPSLSVANMQEEAGLQAQELIRAASEALQEGLPKVLAHQDVRDEEDRQKMAKWGEPD